jgi:hypothetical protein
MDLKVYNEFIDYLLRHNYPPELTPQQKQKLARQATQYIVENGILFKKNKQNPENPLRVITLQDREKILYNLHSSPLAGHFGLKKTIENATRKYYWPGMGADIKTYIESCDSCQRFGKPGKVQLLQSIPVVQPFYQIGIDFIGPLNITPSGNKYILVAVDYFTKWPEAKAVKEATAKETAKFLYETIICQHGTPSIILSDRGTHFVNETIKLMKEEVGFRHKLSSAYHPQTNGLTERFNGTLCRSLAKSLQTSESNWDELIPSILFAYRTLKQESTKYTPFYLVHGREAQLPIDIEFQNQEQNFNPIENFEESLNRRISALKGIFIDAQIINHRNIQHAQELQRNRQQNLKKAQTYEVNDIILLYDSAKQHVHGDKFSIRWNGPFWIQSKLGNNTYLIRDKLGRILQKPIHAEKMKHYKQRYLVEPHVVIAS